MRDWQVNNEGYASQNQEKKIFAHEWDLTRKNPRRLCTGINFASLTSLLGIIKLNSQVINEQSYHKCSSARCIDANH